MNLLNLQKNRQFASVCESTKSSKKNGNWLQYVNLQNLQKKPANCFSMRILKIFKKTGNWAQYVHLKNLQKNRQIASVYEYTKSSKKPAIGFSM